MRRAGRRSVGRRLSRVGALAGTLTGAAALLSATAVASPALLTPGHAYCYYFSSPGYGGMHLVAAGPRVIAAGPSNYISGMGGKPQDTVFYIACTAGPGRAAGDLYVGIPRIVMNLAPGGYSFEKVFKVAHLHHLGVHSRLLSTASLAISGTVVSSAIRGTLHISAPTCLPRPLTIVYSGT